MDWWDVWIYQGFQYFWSQCSAKKVLVHVMVFWAVDVITCPMRDSGANVPAPVGHRSVASSLPDSCEGSRWCFRTPRSWSKNPKTNAPFAYGKPEKRTFEYKSNNWVRMQAHGTSHFCWEETKRIKIKYNNCRNSFFLTWFLTPKTLVPFIFVLF